MDWENVVGRAEIAERCGVNRAAVTNWQNRHPDYPKPKRELKGTLLWSWRDVEQWLSDTGRLPDERIW